MLLDKALTLCAIAVVASLSNGCTVPHYDVPYTSTGQPTVKSIVDRIQCEIRDMVRDDMGDSYVPSFHRLFLLNGDYDVEIALSVEVNDTGGLAPSLSYMHPLTALTSFTFSGNGTLRESRDHNFTENIQLSVRDIYIDWKTGADPHDCPPADTNLSGTLGISDFVAMAAQSQNLDTTNSSGKGVFGGSIQFLITKNVTTVGPTWSLVHFKGPGGLASLSEVNTDKITLAFAQGLNVGKRMIFSRGVKHPLNPDAYFFLQQLLTSSINSQLTILQNSPH